MSADAATPWRTAAAALARRVERRARMGALASALGAGLAAGAALALTARVAGTPAWTGPLVALGALAGLVVGALRARGIARVGLGDAAWALDRLAGAREHGLTAALGAEGRARTAGEPPPEPPQVRLRPPSGLSLLAGGGVLAALALVVGGTETDAAAPDSDDGAERVVAHLTGTAAGPDAAARASREAEERALEAERVRRALGLSAAESADPAAVADRLSDPEARAAARAAATEGGALAEALAGDRPATDAVARGLGSGARAADALETRRRAELGRRGAGAPAEVPAAKRALVERYFVLRARETR
jgi:hypothetical protein